MLPPSGHTPQAIQNHLYQSFLQRATTDITLQVRAKGWNVSYELHRVVLIQAGFFRSLFTTGFLESSRQSKSLKDVLDVQFDDPNITRAAFEICIANLYGGGPQLHVNPALIPTTAHPLTAHFPAAPPYASVPANHHPASPRFLLSLIATSIYLSIPSITAHALSLVLKTIGPTTVTRFLNFAIGKGIGEAEEHEPLCAVGLEDVGQVFVPDSPIRRSVSHSAPTSPVIQEEQEDDVSQKLCGQSVSSDDEGSYAEKRVSFEEADDHLGLHGAVFSYGIVSDKIGEACACWLTRWGSDMLPYEEEFANQTTQPDGNEPRPAVPTRIRSLSQSLSNHPVIPATSTRPSTSSDSSPPAASPLSHQRRSTLPSSTTSPIPAISLSRPLLSPGQCPPSIWSRRGLTARWAAAILSSDDFFYRGGELERYQLATRVVEMRRREGQLALKLAKEAEIQQGGDGTFAQARAMKENQQEDREWEVLFRNGIYYSHMSFDDLLFVRQDVSPTSHKPYISQSTLQSAHWNQSVLRTQITTSLASSSSSRPSSPPLSRTPPSPTSSQPSLRDLNMNVSTSDILTSVASSHTYPDPHSGSIATYFPVLGDGSYKVGGETVPSSSDEAILFSSGVAPAKDAGKRPNDESNFFGIRNSRRTADEVIREDSTGKALWTENEPCRFSVEFWGVESLKPPQRLYSQTIWCFGNLWNVYVQVVRKKGLQLGVYLRRQSFVDPLPSHSIFPTLTPPLHHSASVPAFNASLGGPSSVSLAGSNRRIGDQSSSALGPSSLTRSRPWAVPQSASTTNVSLIRSPTPSTPIASPVQAYGTSSMGGFNSLTSMTPPSATPPPASGTTPHATAPSQMPFSPYRDPRQSLRAYFSISCPSATGISSTKFSSSPDVFNIASSWGWKSSKVEEWVDLEEGSLLSDSTNSGSARTRSVSREVSLRATIVIGVV